MLHSTMKYNWSDSNFYGTKQKRYFSYLDTMLKRLFKEALKQKTELNPELLEQIMNLTARQNTIVHSITKLFETMDGAQRLMDIEQLINAIPAATLAEARDVVKKNNSNWGI